MAANDAAAARKLQVDAKYREGLEKAARRAKKRPPVELDAESGRRAAAADGAAAAREEATPDARPSPERKLALVESRIKQTFGRDGFANEAVGVLRVQDELYRRFKVKYGQAIELNDYLTAERVLLLDAIKAGDVETIRALTNIDWDFVYPPAMLDEPSGERMLEAWCRTPLCLLVRTHAHSLIACG